MSHHAVISAENLGKSYHLNHLAERNRRRYLAFRDVVSEKLKGIFRPSPASDQHSFTEEFWALKDLSFEIRQGEVIGIIGRNGAGKSTLLKILSRITEPSRGRVRIRGRVASLLEVGTGFHPELTGRENVFLNGAILGMTRAEIRAKFDEIIAFAEVEQFLDTPVKRYSSGMYVRLAFAVAAHLEPEILIVDEVLAVGDSDFQKKCLGKMNDVSKKDGRTVLFVSHNMAAVSGLCTSCLMLDKGRMVFRGSAQEGVEAYLVPKQQKDEQSLSLKAHRPSWARPYITSARILDREENEQAIFPTGASLIIEMAFSAPEKPFKKPIMGIVLSHRSFGTVAGVNMRMTDFCAQGGPWTEGVMRCCLTDLPFLPGSYSIDLWLGEGAEDVDTVTGFLHFSIEATDVYGTGRPPLGNLGVAFLRPVWEMKPASQ